jgi:hypothetical protein
MRHIGKYLKGKAHVEDVGRDGGFRVELNLKEPCVPYIGRA